MMVKKLTGFFTILGISVYLGGWVYMSWTADANNLAAMPAEKAWEVGIYLAAMFILLGLFVSTLGIALVQEVLAERRSREIEKKFRAKSAYDRVVNGKVLEL